MKKTKILFLAILIIGCNNQKSINVPDSFSFDARDSKLQFSDVYKSDYKIIRLETTDESVFAIPTKTRLTKENIFILDQTKRLFLKFGIDGTFIGRLENEGVGPGEYVNIADFFYHDSAEEIYIYDDMQRKILSFNKDLQFLKERKVPFYFMKFDCFANGNFVFYTGSMSRQEEKYRFEIIITDNDLNIIEKDIPYGYTNTSRGDTDKLIKKEGADTLLFYTNYSSRIFELTKSDINLRYEISDFNGHTLPPDDFYGEREALGKQNGAVSDDILESEYIYAYKYYEVNNKYIVFYTIGGTTYFSYFNSDKRTQLHTSKLEDDFGFLLDTKYAKPYFFYNDEIGYYIFPHLAIKEHNKKPERYTDPVIGELQIDDNPVIVLFNLK